MPSVGERVGPYEIVALLGAGGMGQVYRARDTRLQREVALKLLPPALASDAERLARFEREARLLAALNHPHIAAIYGYEQGALAMELVEGGTLQGPLAPAEALPLARQICEALEYAHEHGIVHRDLKPANVKVTPEGSVKLLDFGLAKALGADASLSDLENSPTLTHAPTLPGVILGTAAYMAPEQAKGKPVDRRADIWAFGCVLFELLSGRQAFHGETATEVLAAVIMQEPDWARLPATTPGAVRALLGRCLKKDPRQRLQAIGDARLALEEAEAGAGAPETDAGVGPAARGAARWPWMVATAVLALAAAAGFLLRPKPRVARQLRFSITAPTGASRGYGLALSPDGTRLIFAATGPQGTERLWMRRLDALDATPLPGTEGGQFPFWAPDGAAIGFFANGRLQRFDFSSQSVRTLCNISTGGARGGSWSPSGVIVFTPNVTGPLMQVSAEGGTESPATSLGPHQESQRWPFFLPDGRHFLLDAEGSAGSSAIAVGTLGSTTTRTLISMPVADSRAIYADGYLLYSNGSALVARKFDPGRLTLSGSAVPLAQNMPPADINGPTGYVAVTAAGGLLSYLPDSDASSQLEIVDRSGKLLRTIGPPGGYRSTSLSPDGKRVSFSLANPQVVGANDLWILDLASGARTRLTFDQANNNDSVWSPDGQWIYYSSDAGGSYAIYRKRSDGSQAAQLVYGGGSIDSPDTFTRDGRTLLFDLTGASAEGTQIWWMPLGPEPQARWGKPVLYSVGASRAFNSTLSPDGHWVAYESNAAGGSDMEIFAADFPRHAGQWQISYHGGYWPSWSRDGQIYFVSGGHLMTVAVQLGATPRFAPPQALFAVNPPSDATESSPDYAVLPGGREFLLDQLTSAQPSPITVLTHWTRALPH